MQNLIQTYVELKKHDFPITMQERKEIKTYIEWTVLMVGNGSIELDGELQIYFQKEWAEAQELINKNN